MDIMKRAHAYNQIRYPSREHNALIPILLNDKCRNQQVGDYIRAST